MCFVSSPWNLEAMSKSNLRGDTTTGTWRMRESSSCVMLCICHQRLFQLHWNVKFVLRPLVLQDQRVCYNIFFHQSMQCAENTPWHSISQSGVTINFWICLFFISDEKSSNKLFVLKGCRSLSQYLADFVMGSWVRMCGNLKIGLESVSEKTVTNKRPNV